MLLATNTLIDSIKALFEHGQAREECSTTENRVKGTLHDRLALECLLCTAYTCSSCQANATRMMIAGVANEKEHTQSAI